MKYIRTYETEEKFLTDKDSTSREFRLKPTLYKYSDVDNGIYLELDDPRKHGDSTWIRLEFTRATSFSFKIGNVTGDDSNTLNYTIDWGDGTVETNTATRGDDKLYTFTHSYAIGTYDMELYGTDRSYMILGGGYQTYFSSPTAVKRVVIGEKVEIGTSAFYNCTSLTTVYIPESVTSIGDGAFFNCSSLKSIDIPEKVTIIGDSAFGGCTSLTSVYIPKGVTNIEAQAFNGCTSLTSVYIPRGVNSIGNLAFFYCPSLKSVYISDGVTSIGVNTFGQCPSLTSVNIPEGVTSIGDSVFNGCPLTSIYIPEGVTSIGAEAFYSCSSLKSINFPESVTSIGDKAFQSCNSLKSISSLNTTAPTLGSSVFTSMPKNGTLHIKLGATGYDAWLSKLPSGWTIVEDL